MEFIRRIYVLEHEAKAASIAATPEHARTRQWQTLPILDELYVWLAKQKPEHAPKSKMGRAIRYAMRNWQALTRFICNVKLRPDNNLAENALRVVALLRKTSLFSYNERTAKNLAALLTVVATCVAHDVDPLAYLTDILVRLESTRASERAALLPQNWKPP